MSATRDRTVHPPRLDAHHAVRFVPGIMAILLVTGCGDPYATECADGTTRVENRCVRPLPCGPGTHAVEARCVADDAGVADSHQSLGETTWSANTHVTPPDVLWSFEPQIAIDTTGTIYVACMIRDGAQGIGVYSSTDQGQSFTEVARYRPGANSALGDATIAIDRAGRVFVAWARYVGVDWSIQATIAVSMIQDGVTVIDQQTVSVRGAVFADRPWLAVAPDDSVHLSWLEGYPVSIFGAADDFGARTASSMGGQRFGSPVDIVTPHTQRGLYFNTPMVFARGGDAFIAAARHRPDSQPRDHDIRLYQRGSGGAWAEVAILPGRPEERMQVAVDPVMTVAAGDTLAMTFLGVQSQNLAPYVSRSRAADSPWTPPAAATDATLFPGAAATPWITSDARGRLHLMWLDSRLGRWLPYTSITDDGVRFTQPERIGEVPFPEDDNTDRQLGDFVSIVVRGDSRYAAWTDTRAGVSHVYFARSPNPP